MTCDVKFRRTEAVGTVTLAGGVCCAVRMQWDIAAGDGARAPFKLTLFIGSESVRQWKDTTANPCDEFSFRMHENSNACFGSFLSVSEKRKSNKNKRERGNSKFDSDFLIAFRVHFCFIYFISRMWPVVGTCCAASTQRRIHFLFHNENLIPFVFTVMESNL